MRKYLASVAKISQMLPGSVDGTGQGGDRCEPTCAAMIDVTYQLGPSAKAGEAPEQIMEDIARWRNGGALSGPPEGPWLGDWVTSISSGTVTLQAISSTPEAIETSISAGNMIYAGIDDYGQQRLEDGSDPYQWPETEHAGHVEIIAGFDDSNGFAPLLHDPLRGTNGMPAAYSWQSMLNAGLHLYRVAGPALPVEGGNMAPTGWQYDEANGVLTAPNGHTVRYGFCKKVLAAADFDPANVPLNEEYPTATGSQQDFTQFSYVYTTANEQITYAPVGVELHAANAEIATLKAQPPSDPTLQQRLDEAVAALASAQQELALLKAQEPADPVALQQRQVAAWEAMAQDLHQMTRLIPPSAPKLS